MKHKHTVIKLILAVTAALLALGGTGLFIPMRGEWLDRMVSLVLSEKLGLESHCVNARIIRWSEISFERMSVGHDFRNALLESGEGEIRPGPRPFLVVSVKDIRLFQGALRNSFLASLPISKGLQGEFLTHRVTALWSGNHLSGVVHLLECVSDDFQLRGGAKWDNGHLIKAYFYFSLSPDKSKKIPISISRRMIPLKNGWVGTRIICTPNELTLAGLRGPLFQARWQAGYLGVS